MVEQELYVEKLYKKKTDAEARSFGTEYKDEKQRRLKREPPRGFKEQYKVKTLGEFL